MDNEAKENFIFILLAMIAGITLIALFWFSVKSYMGI